MYGYMDYVMYNIFSLLQNWEYILHDITMEKWELTQLLTRKEVELTKVVEQQIRMRQQVHCGCVSVTIEIEVFLFTGN